jgi:S-adenosylmethionine synthetase
MTQITIEQLCQIPTARRRTEHVERKGLGHPDTICVMETVSVTLSQAYVEACGRVLHHNIDKGLLVAGQSAPQPPSSSFLNRRRVRQSLSPPSRTLLTRSYATCLPLWVV